MQNFKQVIDEVKTQFSYIAIKATGSRLFGDYKIDSDWDLVILVESLEESSELATDSHGYSNCGAEDYAGSDESTFICRKGQINLIIVSEPHIYDKWDRCTSLALKLKLDKEQRKVMFSEIINNWS